MALTPDELDAAMLAFLRERHLATLSTTLPDGTSHAVPVGFAYDVDTRLVRIISLDGAQKVRNIERTGRATVTQIDGPRWLSLAGAAQVSRDPRDVERAEAAYAERYQDPRPRDDRVAIEITVERVLGRA